MIMIIWRINGQEYKRTQGLGENIAKLLIAIYLKKSYANDSNYFSQTSYDISTFPTIIIVNVSKFQKWSRFLIYSASANKKFHLQLIME